MKNKYCGICVHYKPKLKYDMFVGICNITKKSVACAGFCKKHYTGINKANRSKP